MRINDTKCPGEIMADRLAAGDDPKEESLMAECEDCHREFHIDADFWPELGWKFNETCGQCGGNVQAFHEGYSVRGGSYSEKYSLPWCKPTMAIHYRPALRYMVQHGDNTLVTLRVAQAAIGGLVAGEEGQVEDMLEWANLGYTDARSVIRWIKDAIRGGWIKA